MLNVHLEHVSPVFREVAEEIKKTGKQIIDNMLRGCECMNMDFFNLSYFNFTF